MIGELERIWKGEVMAKSMCCPGICLVGLRKPQTTPVRIVGVSAEIRKEHFLNMAILIRSIEHHM
jgi:hypothetical protein